MKFNKPSSSTSSVQTPTNSNHDMGLSLSASSSEYSESEAERDSSYDSYDSDDMGDVEVEQRQNMEIPHNSQRDSNDMVDVEQRNDTEIPHDSQRDSNDMVDVEQRNNTEIPHGSQRDSNDTGDVDQMQNTNTLHHLQREQSVSNHAKLQTILSCLSRDVGESELLHALIELCELLSFCTEDSISTLIAGSLSPILIKLARYESNPDIMLFAIRALTYLCDVHPQSSVFVVNHDGISVLCQRLMAIEYVDVAEQCFQALEKISEEQPLACLQSGVIMAVLTYIDFFSAHLQRVALATVLNICDELPSEPPSLFMEAVPTLCNLLQYEDSQLVETVVYCLTEIAERVRHSPNMLDELSNHGLIHQATQLINLNSRTTLSQPVYTGLFEILAILASGSLIALKILFELNISSILKDILSTYGPSLGAPSSPNVDGHSNQALEVLKLVNELLPVIGVNQDVQLEKEVFLVAYQPHLLQKFGNDLLPVLIKVVSSGGDLHACYACLSVVNKLVYFSNLNMLLELLKSTNVSSFLAGIFTRKDHHVLTLALQIVDNILQKLAGVYVGPFVKEGVFFAIDSLLVKGIQLSHDSSQRSADRDAQRCLCYLFDAGQSPSTSESGSCRLGKDSVQNLAKHIKTKYFANESSNSEDGVTDSVYKLKASSSALTELVNMSMDDGSFMQNEAELFSVLHNIMSQINGSDPISTFEFVESGVMKSLADYLSNGQCSRGKTVDCAVSQPYFIEKRLESFGRLFLISSDPGAEKFPLSAIISKLQSALSSVENFPVIFNPVSKPRKSHVTVPHPSVTTYPSLKVQFIRGEGETDLSDYFDVVTVDPFSSFDSIGECLWPNVGKKGSEHKETATADALDGNYSHLPVDASSQYPDVKEIDGASPIMHAMQNLMNQERQNSMPEDSITGPECPESCSSENASPKLAFYLEGEQLDATLNLYQAIIQLKSKSENDTVTAATLWSQMYKVTYRRASKEHESNSQQSDHQASCSSAWSNSHYTPFFSSMSVSKLASAVEKFSPTYDILFLLRILEGMNRYRFHLMSRERICAFAEGRIADLDNLKVESSDALGNEFVSCRLTEKLEQQMRDPLAISPRGMPAWIVQLMDLCPFLFGFEGRSKYFKLAASDKHHGQPSSSSNSHSNVRPPRRKYKVYRHQILESAAKMMELHAGKKAVLEVEYNEEVGTGLGPTLEFFTLVSNEFQNTGMGMWREDNTSLPSIGNRIVGSPFGLFPRPWSSTMSVSGGVEFSEVLKKFVLLGQVVAKALQDGRVLDISFSKAFYKLILGQDLTLYDIQSFDPELGRVLIEFQALVQRRKYIESSEGKSMLQVEPSFRNATIEDLCLDFTLPGYPDYVLISGTNIEMVNMMNLEEYVAQVVDATVNLGISRQIDAFKAGFNQVFPISHLQIFNEEELERLLCGEREILNLNELSDHMKFDHGYTASSPQIINFLEILQEFNQEQQKAFLRFVTGAPRLPQGGLASLNPKLTIVRKHCDGNDDEVLPSVMTCANYLKLPPYSSKETMKDKLLYAITEGQGSFHLS